MKLKARRETERKKGKRKRRRRRKKKRRRTEKRGRGKAETLLQSMCLGDKRFESWSWHLWSMGPRWGPISSCAKWARPALAGDWMKHTGSAWRAAWRSGRASLCYLLVKRVGAGAACRVLDLSFSQKTGSYFLTPSLLTCYQNEIFNHFVCLPLA